MGGKGGGGGGGRGGRELLTLAVRSPFDCLMSSTVEKEEEEEEEEEEVGLLHVMDIQYI